MIALLLFVAALLYASVGHAGGSGFLAVMALLNVAPATMKPAALVLNICSASVATFRYRRAGFFSWRLFWPFTVSSVPFAYLGGTMVMSSPVYKLALGGFLLISALWLLSARHDDTERRTLSIPWAVVIGATIGFASGLIGIGGGVFLSPVILFLKWGDVREAAGVSAPFILVNSIAALGGHVVSVRYLPPYFAWWAVAAIVGAAIGAELGSRHLQPAALRAILSIVLAVAALKLIIPVIAPRLHL